MMFQFRVPDLRVANFHLPDRWVQLQWAALGAGSLTVFVLAFVAIAPPAKPPAASKPDPVSLARLDFGCQACDRLRLTLAAKPLAFATRALVSADQLAERFANPAAGTVPARVAEAVPEMAAAETVADRDALENAAAPKPAAVTAPSLYFELKRNSKTGARTAFPFQVQPSAGNRRGKIMIAQVPAGVSFTSGQRSGPGLWVLNVAEAPVTDMLIEPDAPAAFALTFMLLNREGTVVSGIDMAVALIDVKPAKAEKAEKPDGPANKPLPKAYSLGRQSQHLPAPAPSREPVKAAGGLRGGVRLASIVKLVAPEVKRAEVEAPATFFAPKPFLIPQTLGTSFTSMN